MGADRVKLNDAVMHLVPIWCNYCETGEAYRFSVGFGDRGGGSGVSSRAGKMVMQINLPSLPYTPQTTFFHCPDCQGTVTDDMKSLTCTKLA